MDGLEVDEHWEYEAVNLCLRKAGLGMSIKGGLDSPDQYDDPHIYVSKVFTDGMAYADGRLQLGDVILSVNGFPLIDVMHFEAVDAIISAGTEITLYVKRKRCTIYERIPTPPVPDDTYDEPREYEEVEGIEDQVDNDQSLDGDDNEGHIPGLISVELNKGDKGFGICISGGYDNQHIKGENGIYVTKVVDNGVAHRNGRIVVGDQLMAINDIDLENVSYDEAVAAMRSSPMVSVLIVRRK
ncbi:unnamed protein product [Oppiella nova]|uniref:PDZ domain-containing protein n=1 Tax=Oppiella nova TaxID=334625 RepID=A0A7R9M8S0_9ACAR|nr:unnamed protein product [Oppiella nova]CAG2171770.1 unnamed protein product [Oppiella nova]